MNLRPRAYGAPHGWDCLRAACRRCRAASPPARLLAIWGKNDPFFIPAGAQAYRSDVPAADVVLLDTGHFALEEEADTIAAHVSDLMSKTFG